MDELKDFISQALWTLMLTRISVTVCHSVGDMFQECYNVGGGHFEHLRDYTIPVKQKEIMSKYYTVYLLLPHPVYKTNKCHDTQVQQDLIRGPLSEKQNSYSFTTGD